MIKKREIKKDVKVKLINTKTYFTIENKNIWLSLVVRLYDKGKIW